MIIEINNFSNLPLANLLGKFKKRLAVLKFSKICIKKPFEGISINWGISLSSSSFNVSDVFEKILEPYTGSNRLKIMAFNIHHGSIFLILIQK